MDKFLKEEMRMQIHHIGGIKDCGPAEQLGMLKEDAKWNFYDADQESLNQTKWNFYDADQESLNQTSIENKDYKLIGRAIGGIDHPNVVFNILKSPSASSFLLPAESAKDMIIQGTEETWGDHTELMNKAMIRINKLDTLIKKGEIGKIDVLSIDVQGMELDVIRGAGANLKDILAIICEVEFRELYENQPLFFNIFEDLNERGYDLWAIYNLQYFNKNNYPKPLRGFGVLTAGEALFVRNPDPLFENLTKENIIKLIKIALIAICYDQKDIAFHILHELELKGISIDILEETYSIKELKKAYNLAKSIIWRDNGLSG